MKTEIGKIARLLQADDPITPLQKRMTDFGKKLSYIILLICALLFGAGMLRGEEPIKMLLLAISLAVAAIPEAGAFQIVAPDRSFVTLQELPN